MTWQNPQNTAQYPYSVPKTPSPAKSPYDPKEMASLTGSPAPSSSSMIGVPGGGYSPSDMYTTSYIPGTNTGGAKTPYPSAPEAPSQATMQGVPGTAGYDAYYSSPPPGMAAAGYAGGVSALQNPYGPSGKPPSNEPYIPLDQRNTPGMTGTEQLYGNPYGSQGGSGLQGGTGTSEMMTTGYWNPALQGGQGREALPGGPPVNYDQLTPSNPYTMARDPAVPGTAPSYPYPPYGTGQTPPTNYNPSAEGGFNPASLTWEDVEDMYGSQSANAAKFFFSDSNKKKNQMAYNPNESWNVPAPEGWPAGIPFPPPGVLPGTGAYGKWLRNNGIDERSPLNNLIQEHLYRYNNGVMTPDQISPWEDTPDGFAKYMQWYLDSQGLGKDDVPDSFRQDLYDQIYGGVMNDAMAGGQMAAGYIEDFDPTQAAGFDTLSQYMDMQSGYLDKYGGYMGFDPEGLQNAGLAQSEIARAAAERSMGNQIASAGLTGQANSAYMSAPMYADYLNSRINAVQNPVMAAAQIGTQGVGTTMGALTDLYGLGQNADIARAGAFGDIYGRGLGVAAGTGAQVGLGAAGQDLDAFLEMQRLYGSMPLTGYELAMGNNEYLNDIYQRSLDQSNIAKDRKAGRKAGERAQTADIIGGSLGAVGTLAAALYGGGG